MISVTPSGRSHTTGCPVHPLPHQDFVSPPTVDRPHPISKDQAIDGSVGTGPVPYQVRLGLPRNWSRPSTGPSRAIPTVRASTKRANGSSGSVVVVVVLVVVELAAAAMGGATVVEVVGTVTGSVVVTPALPAFTESARGEQAAPTRAMPTRSFFT